MKKPATEMAKETQAMTAKPAPASRHADGPAAGDPQSTSLDAQANAALDAALREAGRIR